MAPPHKGVAAALSPARLDAFLVRLNDVMQTPSGSDAVLATVCYGARTASVLLTAAAGRQLVGDAVALGLAKRLRALGSLMAEMRMMTRLWGMLSMYVWARQLLQQLLAQKKSKSKSQSKSKGKGKDKDTAANIADTIVAWSQLISCSAYQVLENGAFLAQHGILPLPPAVQTTAYLWSSRAFCVYVAVELGRLAAALAASHGALAAALAAAATGTTSTGTTNTTNTTTTAITSEKRAEIVELQRSAMRYMAFAPATINWSMQKGFLGEPAVTMLGMVPAALQIHKIWTEAIGKS